MLYGLPDFWNKYSLRVYPLILPYLLPMVQIAMMISIYTTILISFERYVRIGHTCRFKDYSYLTDDNLKYYIIAIILGPCIFYIPKFFELRAVTNRVSLDITVDCVPILQSTPFNFSPFMAGSSPFGNISDRNILDQQKILMEEMLQPIPTKFSFLEKCLSANFSENFASDYTNLINVTQIMETIEIKSTDLRQNPLYYKIYCIFLNTLVSTAFPLLSLLYLNIYTVLALKMIGKENGAAVSSRISNVRRRSLVQGSGSAVRIFGNKKPLKSDIRTVEGHLTEPKPTNKIISGDTKKWKKTTNSFEMSVLKKQKQAKKEVRLNFIRETKSIEVVMMNGTAAEGGDTEAKRRYWRKVSTKLQLTYKNKKNKRISTRENSLSDTTTTSKGWNHFARSESECEYSPQKRNTSQMLRQRGVLTEASSKRRYKKDRSHNFRKRAYSAPNEIQSLTGEVARSLSPYNAIEDLSKVTATTDFENVNKVMMLDHTTEAKHHEIPPDIHEALPSEAASLHLSLLRSGEARLTRIALAIVWLFIFCHAWRLIPTIYEAFYPGDDSLPTWLRHIHGISHSFIVFNSAVNFLLYTLL